MLRHSAAAAPRCRLAVPSVFLILRHASSNATVAANMNVRRTGLLGIKCGMTSEWDEWGVRHPLTVVKVDSCKVVQVKTPEKEGYMALQVGCTEKKEKRVTKPMKGHFSKANVESKRHLQEFLVTEDALLPVGAELFAAHFVPGQKVDVAG